MESQFYILLHVSRINPLGQNPRRMTDLTQLLCLYLSRKLKVPWDWLNQINRLGLTRGDLYTSLCLIPLLSTAKPVAIHTNVTAGKLSLFGNWATTSSSFKGMNVKSNVNTSPPLLFVFQSGGLNGQILFPHIQNQLIHIFSLQLKTGNFYFFKHKKNNFDSLDVDLTQTFIF